MSRKPEAPTGRAAIEEIDRRLGGLLGPLAEGLARLVDAAEQAQGASGPREATVETGRGPLRVRTGLSVRLGGLAAAAAPAAAGRDPAEPLRPAPAAVPEPPFDVWEDAEGWSLTADLPGAGPDDLRLTPEPGHLTVETAGARPRRLRVALPDWVAPAALETRLTNGVLEISARRGAGA